MHSTLSHLECSRCGQTHSADEFHGLCRCGGPLLARYDLERATRTFQPESLRGRERMLWRYSEVLPGPRAEAVSLGEGGTPLLPLKRLGQVLGLSRLSLKDEAFNPTGSFKARGLAVAVSRARSLGAKSLAIPSAGNAGGALAAYAAAAGLEAHIFMPRDVPQANYLECRACGAHVVLVDGLIGDCARVLAERKEEAGWFDVSTLKEPFRIEGKKTMGYELFEQYGGRLPDAILYPTGGGVGLIGMWKAFEEMESLNWIGGKRPKMIAVQAAGCAPIVQAFSKKQRESEPWKEAATLASGLRVPKALGDFLALDAIYRSGGTAIAVTDEEILVAVKQLAKQEGIFACPEGAATIAALPALLASGALSAEEEVVVFNTGSGMKYLDVLENAFGTKEGEA